MILWWNSLSLVAQIFALIAVPTTLVLVIQTVLMLIGIGGEAAHGDAPDAELLTDAGTDADVDVHLDDGVFADGAQADTDPTGIDTLKLLSVRGIIAFLVVFGWVGYGMENAGAALFITLPVAVICGFVMMALLALLVRLIMKLRNSGNIDNRNAVGVSGKVYLTVPAARGGEGKVNIMLQGSFVERDAVTDDPEDIPTGSQVVVMGTSGQTTLVVRRK